jgi:hypothetical protein
MKSQLNFTARHECVRFLKKLTLVLFVHKIALSKCSISLSGAVKKKRFSGVVDIELL